MGGGRGGLVGGGGGGGGHGVGLGGDQSGCELRSEAFVKIQKKKNWGGGGGGGVVKIQSDQELGWGRWG